MNKSEPTKPLDEPLELAGPHEPHEPHESKEPKEPKEPSELTIGRLAKAAHVGVETIRYYQRRNLLPTPRRGHKAFRYYPAQLIDRIRFIKRAQELGFTLDEIATLLQLNDGADRRSIRKLANVRLTHIRSKIADLQKIETSLAHLLHECEKTSTKHACPIIEAFSLEKLEPV